MEKVTVSKRYGWSRNTYASTLELLCVDTLFNASRDELCNVIRSALGFRVMYIIKYNPSTKPQIMYSSKAKAKTKSGSRARAQSGSGTGSQSQPESVRWSKCKTWFCDAVTFGNPMISNDMASDPRRPLPQSLIGNCKKVLWYPLYEHHGDHVILVGARRHTTIHTRHALRVMSLKNIIYVLMEHSFDRLKSAVQVFVKPVYNMIAPMNKLYRAIAESKIEHNKDIEESMVDILHEIQSALNTFDQNWGDDREKKTL